jgi:hypothetical protein
MKTMKIATLSLAALLYATVAFAQHGQSANAHGGGTGSGMGNLGSSNGMGHTNTPTDHGKPNTASSTLGSAHGKTVDDILAKDTKLADKISSLTGESATDACSGFRNLGQCVAAAHVSKNLGISFDCLKDDMTGTAPIDPKSCPAGTGANGKMSLGKSIQALDPQADQKAETKKADTEAQKDLNNTSTKS